MSGALPPFVPHGEGPVGKNKERVEEGKGKMKAGSHQIKRRETMWAAEKKECETESLRTHTHSG